MSSRLEKALEKATALLPDEQDAIASEILASLADEKAWKKRFAEKGDVTRNWGQLSVMSPRRDTREDENWVKL